MQAGSGFAELSEIKDRFLKHSDADLMRAAARQIYAGVILLMQEVQGKVGELTANPRDTGFLFKSLLRPSRRRTTPWLSWSRSGTNSRVLSRAQRRKPALSRSVQ